MMAKLNRAKQKMYLFLLLCSISSLLFAQNPDKIEKLQGKWILEDASILKIEGNDSIKVNIDNMVGNINLGVFSVWEFADGKLKLSSKENPGAIVGIPQITKDSLFLDFLARDYIYEYKQTENYLFIKQEYSPQESLSWHYLMVMKYKKN